MDKCSLPLDKALINEFADTKLSEMVLPEEQVLGKLNAVSTAKRLANMVSFVSILRINFLRMFYPYPPPASSPLVHSAFRLQNSFFGATSSTRHHILSPTLFLNTDSAFLGFEHLDRNCTIPTSENEKRSTGSKMKSANPISLRSPLRPATSRGFGFICTIVVFVV